MKKNYYHKKSPLFLSFFILLLLGAPLQGAGNFHPFTIKLKNSLHMERNDQMIAVSISSIKERFKDFDKNNFIINPKGFSHVSK